MYLGEIAALEKRNGAANSEHKKLLPAELYIPKLLHLEVTFGGLKWFQRIQQFIRPQNIWNKFENCQSCKHKERLCN